MKNKIFLLTVLLTLPLLYFLYSNGIFRFNYPSNDKFPIQGIDVSHHQGDINWEKLAQRKNIRFTYIKATEGGDFKDSNFTTNWSGAKKSGFLRGAYHFFTFCRSGKDQANNFLGVIPKEDIGELPIAIDLEFLGNCNKRPTQDELFYELNSFIREVQKLHPVKPVFYVTQEFFNSYLKENISRLPEHYLWLRSVFFEPEQEKCKQWAIWQYADNYRVDGINQPVDINAYCAGEKEFIDMLPMPKGMN